MWQHVSTLYCSEIVMNTAVFSPVKSNLATVSFSQPVSQTLSAETALGVTLLIWLMSYRDMMCFVAGRDGEYGDGRT